MWWLILGLIVGVVGYWLVLWTRAKGVKVTWYEWLIAVIALLFALGAIQNFFASFAELESQAAWVLLLLFGVPALVLGAVDWFLVKRRRAKPAKS